MKKLFTKSRFKIALECPTKLYYYDLKDEANKPVYKNRMSEDAFLQTLADGGHMVGEMAKFVYHPSPQDPDITVRERRYDESVAETVRRLSIDIASGKTNSVIAEAAIRHGDFFIRIDILVADHINKTLTLVEVKAKSVKNEELQSGFKNKKGYESKWLPYLYDVAFQTLVTEQALETMMEGAMRDYRVIPKLMLVYKEVPCERDGLNEYFKVIRDPSNPREMEVRVKPGTTRAELGDLSFLHEVDMTHIVNELRTAPIPGDFMPSAASRDLGSFMNWACQVQQSGERYFSRPDKRCKSCQFRARTDKNEQSGIHECWAHAIGEGWLQGDASITGDREIPLSVDLWGGRSGPVSYADSVLQAGHAFLSDILEASIAPKKTNDPKDQKFTSHERRMLQIELERNPLEGFRIQKETLRDYIHAWDYPWHMIDFETSAPSIPFFEGMRPYQTVAFQFSHHRMDEDGTITHAHQFIKTDAKGNPNIIFVRELKKALMPDGKLVGTVFMYTGHERTVLQQIGAELCGRNDLPDYEELMQFIQLLAGVDTSRNKFEYSRRLRDLHDLVLKTYVSRHARGSNSLKYILPAILKDAPNTAAIYAKQGVYGKGLTMHSMNFEGPEGHQWLTTDSNGDPYKTLPPLFDLEGISAKEVDELLGGLFDVDGGKIDQGGLAMAAYNLTRYTDLGDADRKKIQQGLLRYCELDTLAMCMLVQGLKELAGV